MPKKTKQERRYIAISRILRKRNYGFKKVLNQYNKSIYSTVYSKTRTDKIGREMYKQLKGQSSESLQDLYDELNNKIKKLSPRIAKYISAFLSQGSSKIFDQNGQALKLQKPKYDKEIEKLVENNLKYVKGVTDDQRKKILDVLSKGIKDGKTYSQMSDDIVSEVDNLSKNRAELIASNEGHLAHARAQEDTMKLNGIKKYQWITARDDRVSAICQSYHRQIFEYGKLGKMQWRDINGKVHNVFKSPRPIRDSHIRCRCIVIAVID